MLAKFLNLMLNYQYGLSIVVAPDPTKASSLMSEHEGKVRCVCVIQEEEITEQTTEQTTLLALGQRGNVPLFLILPTKKLGLQRMACSGLGRVSFCAWEQAFS
ncbi:MAG: hypothetical protein VYD18_15480 [Candidatus Latescibacterota bacterium]|nr:hypothetical protein [Candidatus Latescibacterota bacterium]